MAQGRLPPDGWRWTPARQVLGSTTPPQPAQILSRIMAITVYRILLHRFDGPFNLFSCLQAPSKILIVTSKVTSVFCSADQICAHMSQAGEASESLLACHIFHGTHTVHIITYDYVSYVSKKWSRCTSYHPICINLDHSRLAI